MINLHRIDEGAINREVARKGARPSRSRAVPGKDPGDGEENLAGKAIDEDEERETGMREIGSRSVSRIGRRGRPSTPRVAEERKSETPGRKSYQRFWHSALSPKGVDVSASGAVVPMRSSTREETTLEIGGLGKADGLERWTNRPWQKFVYANSLVDAGKKLGLAKEFLKRAVDRSSDAESWVDYVAAHIDEAVGAGAGKDESVRRIGRRASSIAEDAGKKTCCICGKEFRGWGNDPYPVKDEGDCCDECNYRYVLPARWDAIEKMLVQKGEASPGKAKPESFRRGRKESPVSESYYGGQNEPWVRELDFAADVDEDYQRGVFDRLLDTIAEKTGKTREEIVGPDKDEFVKEVATYVAEDFWDWYVRFYIESDMRGDEQEAVVEYLAKKYGLSPDDLYDTLNESAKGASSPDKMKKDDSKKLEECGPCDGSGCDCDDDVSAFAGAADGPEGEGEPSPEGPDGDEDDVSSFRI